MSRPPSARLRGVLTLVGLVAGIRPLFSQDQPAPPPAHIGAADTIEAARDGIRGLKVERDARNLPEGNRPRVAAPEWHGGAASAVPPARPARQNPAADSRNPNWLVDALQPPDAAGGPAREGEAARSGRAGTRNPLERGELTRSRAGLEPAESRSTAEQNPISPGRPGTGAIANPLAAYLDGWMTPQDFALLKPGLDGRPAAVLPLPATDVAAGGFPAGPLLPAGAIRGASPSSVATAGARPDAVRENPFLAALNAPVAGSTVTAQTPRLTVPAPGSAALATPSLQSPPSPPPAPRVPDFARPAADEKYFKPLKRF